MGVGALAMIKKIFISCVVFLLVGCSSSADGIVTARDVLKQDPHADILKYKGRVHSNVTILDWFDSHKDQFEKHELLGEIKKQSTNRFWFSNMTATKLPIGTKVYKTSESETDFGVLFVYYEGEELFYMMQLGG